MHLLGGGEGAQLQVVDALSGRRVVVVSGGVRGGAELRAAHPRVGPHAPARRTPPSGRRTTPVCHPDNVARLSPVCHPRGLLDFQEYVPFRLTRNIKTLLTEFAVEGCARPVVLWLLLF